MKEVWKDIAGYEGLYQVSNSGNVKSLDRFIKRKGQGDLPLKGGIVKQYSNRGYKVVTLSKESKIRQYKVHRLVALAFLPNPDNLPQINHKDENPANNSVENLEWCDGKYNSNYGTRSQRMANSKKGIATRKGKKNKKIN